VIDGVVGVGICFLVEVKGVGRGGEMVVEIMEFEWFCCLCNVILFLVMDVDGIFNFESMSHGMRLLWDWGMRFRGFFCVLIFVLVFIGFCWECCNWIGFKDYLEG